MWTFTSDSTGYMLFLNGKPMGGAGTLKTQTYNPRRRAWQHIRADAKMYREQAARICLERNASGFPPMRNA
jgi:hypothetical protein